MINYLYVEHRTIPEVAKEFGVSERTAYRYINLLDSIGFEIEQDFKKKYFIPKGCYPSWIDNIKQPITTTNQTREYLNQA